MCGLAGIVGPSGSAITPDRIARVQRMMDAQRHRGPDGEGRYVAPSGLAVLGHRRLRVLDLTDAGKQPLSSPDGRYHIVFNGEVYNYLELRRELGPESFRTETDTEVVLRAFAKWGPACLDRFLGMFAFAIWDETERRLFAARDRFGVKPFHYTTNLEGGTLAFASEPKALHAAGLPARPDPVAWSTWLVHGLSDHGPRTFADGVSSLPAGHTLTFTDGALTTRRWYDLRAQIGAEDARPDALVIPEVRALLEESVSLRFRSDVPVGINLSGGLDSSVLLGLVQAVQGAASTVNAFTFATGDPAYDETPWVAQMLAHTRHPSVLATLSPTEVPRLAREVHAAEDGPAGGLPTLAYARLFEAAAKHATTVLLDGQGMDEQWAGYDYYRTAAAGSVAGSTPADGSGPAAPLIQGTRDVPLRPGCLAPAFRALAEPPPPPPSSSDDPVRDLQVRDLTLTKIPRALRFNERISMRASRELREPFLDHRLVELALRQPLARKVNATTGKVLVRQLAATLLPQGLHEAPKRPLQTPQREWLRGPLADWAKACVVAGALGPAREWFEPAAVRTEIDAFLAGRGDTSYFVWQWIDVGLMADRWMGTARSA